MKVLIEEYRGWEINFDTDREGFYLSSERYDKEDTKRSYAAAKKFIDEYIKQNEKFVPFYVVTIPSSYKSKVTRKIIGIRKDGRFVYEDDNGKKHQLSEYDEKDYMLINEVNESLFKELDELEKEISVLHECKKELEGKFHVESLKSVKHKYKLP